MVTVIAILKAADGIVIRTVADPGSPIVAGDRRAGHVTDCHKNIFCPTRRRRRSRAARRRCRSPTTGRWRWGSTRRRGCASAIGIWWSLPVVRSPRRGVCARCGCSCRSDMARRTVLKRKHQKKHRQAGCIETEIFQRDPQRLSSRMPSSSEECH